MWKLTEAERDSIKELRAAGLPVRLLAVRPVCRIRRCVAM
jgi:hypothetical protein